uniref:Uncharacterized protein n=1 Tax=Chryseobacterium endophyticum TaxID=1854762 RepID=A0AAU6WME2_9FLAO
MEKSPFEQFEELRIDAAAKSFLGEAAKWTTFLSILGYIGIGFMVLASVALFAVGSSLSMGPMRGGIWMGIFTWLWPRFILFRSTCCISFHPI